MAKVFILLRGGVDCQYPKVSPDGKKLAFTSWDQKNEYYAIYVSDYNGFNVRKLTSSKGDDMYPAWSKDGKKIAFTSDRSGRKNIWFIEV